MYVVEGVKRKNKGEELPNRTLKKAICQRIYDVIQTKNGNMLFDFML
jgi:hypothetical protein